MLFNSFSFIAFLPVVVFLYYVLPHKVRWFLLLIASCYFYMAFVPKYILILFVLIIVDYYLALLIEKEENNKKRKTYLVFGIISNLGLLFVFKYFNFFNENLNTIAKFFDWNYSIEYLKLALPLGLSFHTFQSLSYLIEVYRKNQKAEKHFGIYSLFILFFPQLVAGPIERAGHMLPQFHKNHEFKLHNITSGLSLVVWGFFLKIVVGDRVGLLVDAFYANPHNFVGPASIFALILFLFQLYGDFAGYTMIALGSAKMLDFELSENFRRPYLSRSVSEFWQRWHISLSSWLRDYVYQSILSSYKRLSIKALYVAIIVTFLLSGIWHGAGWNFIIMGLFYGLVISFGLATKKFRDSFAYKIGLNSKPKIRAFLQTTITVFFVSIGWLFFRAPNINTLWQVLKTISVGWEEFLNNFYNTTYLKQNFTFGYEWLEIIVTITFIVLLMTIEIIQEKKPKFIEEKIIPNIYLKTFGYTVLILSIIVFGEFHQKVFIYFKF